VAGSRLSGRDHSSWIAAILFAAAASKFLSGRRKANRRDHASAQFPHE